MDVDVVRVTPSKAREWLETTRINRPCRGDQVKAYARDMRAGNWRPVGDPIRFDNTGALIDGQHRLSAIVESGVSLDLIVINDLDAKDQLVVDSGIKRRPADQLILEGHKYGVRVASVARLLYSISIDRPYDNALRVTNAEIFETLGNNPTIIDSVRAVDGLQRVAGVTPLNAGVAHFLGSVKIPVTTYRFFEALRNGANLSATDPALLLRNRLLSGFDVPSRLPQLWLVLRCLIMAKEDIQTYTKLQLPRDSRVSPEALKEQVAKLNSYRDEREV